jgi:hypothetical protein
MNGNCDDFEDEMKRLFNKGKELLSFTSHWQKDVNIAISAKIVLHLSSSLSWLVPLHILSFPPEGLQF